MKVHELLKMLSECKHDSEIIVLVDGSIVDLKLTMASYDKNEDVTILELESE